MLRHKTEEHHNRNVPVNVVCSVRTRSFLNSVSDFRVSTGARFVASDVLCEKFPGASTSRSVRLHLTFFRKKITNSGKRSNNSGGGGVSLYH